MNAMYLLEAMTNIDGTLIENARPVPRRSGKSVARILLLAALLAALAMTAFASEEITNWFRSYFGRWSEEPLTESQIAFIEENTTDISQSQTCLGYTITVESAITDGNNGFIKLKLIAPEHVKLDSDFYYPGNLAYLTSTQPDQSSTFSMSCDLVEDDDALDNTVSLVITVRGSVDDRTQWNLNIKSIKTTYFENLETEDFSVREETVAVGNWNFDITFENTGNGEVEFITDPVPGRINRSLEEPIYVDVYITSLKLRAMSAEIKYECVDPEIYNREPHIPAGDFEPIYVVMKDGSEVWMANSGGYPGGVTFQFFTPIVLEEVSHVLLPDGTKLPIPTA